MDTFVSNIKCHFSGHVQGVGFRHQAFSIAKGFEITGYVKNLSDGRVELSIEGDKIEIHSYLDTLEEEMDVFITKVDKEEGESKKRFKHFSILA